MEKKQLSAECLKYFNSGGTGGFNCAESTVYGVTSVLNLPQTDLLRIATPLGGGLARNGYVCGSLLAGILLLGYKLGRDNPDAPRNPSYEAADKLVKIFLDRFGAVHCRELTGLDLKNINNTGEEKQRVHNTVCRPIVEQVCQWVVELYKAE
ncbi:MAG: C-GCAxxG-C-C family protein [Spirochaetales bacterium]